MTPSEINAMQAGRELDALVAEKVMEMVIHKAGDLDLGWEQKGGPTPPEWYVRGIEKDVLMVERVPPPGYYRYIGIPAYSTSISAAWGVLTKLSVLRDTSTDWPGADGRSRFYKPVVRLEWFEHDNQAECRIGRCKGFDEDTDVVAKADSIELAICRAALKAVIS